jgi:hypothetical protein
MSKGIVLAGLLITSKGGDFAHDGFYLYRRVLPYVFARVKTREQLALDLLKLAAWFCVFGALLWVVSVPFFSWHAVLIWVLVSACGIIENVNLPAGKPHE